MTDERLLGNWEREAKACLRGDHSQRELQLAAVIVTLIDELRATRAASLAPSLRPETSTAALHDFANQPPEDEGADPSRCEHPYLNRVYRDEGELTPYFDCSHCGQNFFLGDRALHQRADAAPAPQGQRHFDVQGDVERDQDAGQRGG